MNIIAVDLGFEPPKEWSRINNKKIARCTALHATEFVVGYLIWVCLQVSDFIRVLDLEDLEHPCAASLLSQKIVFKSGLLSCAGKTDCYGINS